LWQTRPAKAWGLRIKKKLEAKRKKGKKEKIMNAEGEFFSMPDKRGGW